MTAQTLTPPFLQATHQRLCLACERARSLTGGLSAAQLNWKPAADKWSVAQCLDHMLLAADEYLEKMLPVVERARARKRIGLVLPKPRHTLVGRLIIAFVEPTAKRTMKSPKSFRPAQSDIAPDIVDRFLKSHETLTQLIAHCDGLDLNAMKLSSPESRLLRINISDAIEILVSHAERHLNQAKRVRQLPDFPD